METRHHRAAFAQGAVKQRRPIPARTHCSPSLGSSRTAPVPLAAPFRFALEQTTNHVSNVAATPAGHSSYSSPYNCFLARVPRSSVRRRNGRGCVPPGAPNAEVVLVPSPPSIGCKEKIGGFKLPCVGQTDVAWKFRSSASSSASFASCSAQCASCIAPRASCSSITRCRAHRSANQFGGGANPHRPQLERIRNRRRLLRSRGSKRSRLGHRAGLELEHGYSFGSAAVMYGSTTDRAHLDHSIDWEYSHRNPHRVVWSADELLRDVSPNMGRLNAVSTVPLVLMRRYCHRSQW
jgi:hypothetical protein